MAQLSPLINNAAYQKKDGAYDLGKRQADLLAGEAKLEPQAHFARGDQYAAEQRWLAVDLVLLVIALFWLTLAQISPRASAT